MKNWMVRAGEGGHAFEEFKRKHVVAVGWKAVGDLSDLSSYEAVKDRVRQKYPDSTEGQVAAYAGTLHRFKNEISREDYVVTYDRQDRSYVIGKVTGEYDFREVVSGFPNTRKVVWQSTKSRDELSVASRNSLGSIMTLFEIQPNVMEELLSSSGRSLPASEIVDEAQQIEKDVAEKAHEFIKDKVLHLRWDEMQEAVAGVIRAMGYKTRVSAKGPDRGKDIVASPDGLGLEEPSIRIEVKHRKGKMGSREIKSFIAGLRKNKGLFISTGGFSKDAHLEAERSNIPVTLVDADFLVDLIVENYDRFDPETKTLIPLRKIYWPS